MFEGIPTIKIPKIILFLLGFDFLQRQNHKIKVKTSLEEQKQKSGNKYFVV